MSIVVSHLTQQTHDQRQHHSSSSQYKKLFTTNEQLAPDKSPLSLPRKTADEKNQLDLTTNHFSCKPIANQCYHGRD
ncbi:MAG: hypothetical protein LBJ00_18220 [Planctomycetaceae bacterium]|nr:hypothetical protein [Planctomycetaceae bacterium]